MVYPIDTISDLSVVHTGATAPATPRDGDLWYNTTTNTLSVYVGGAWSAISGGGGGGGPMKLTDLTDVTVTDPVGIDGMVLRYDDVAKQWVNDQNVDGGSY